jgi:predicted deacylase
MTIERNSIIVFSAILFILFSTLAGKNVFEVGDISTQPGEKVSGYVIVPPGEDSEEIKVPLTVINGTKDGPVLALFAGVHGYEYPPVIAMMRLAKKLDPAKISGKIIIVHVANVPSFFKRTIYYSPYDWKNLNRVFPGKVDGTNTERIAYELTREVIDQCDYLIDNHCGDGNEDLMNYLYCTKTGNIEIDEKIKGLALNYNFKVIVHDKGRPNDIKQSKYVSNTAIVRGKPAITIESGKLGQSPEEDINEIVRGTYNILKHLKMLPGDPIMRFESVWVEEQKILRSQHTGLFFPLLSRGDHVQEGEKIAYITDYFGNVIQEIESPYSGILLYIVATPPMSKGEPMAFIGKF